MGKILEFENTTKASQKQYESDEKLNNLTDILNDTIQKLNDTGIVLAGEIILYTKTDKSEGFVSAKTGLGSLESQVLFITDFLNNDVRSLVKSKLEKVKEDNTNDGEDGGKTE